jgi:hypothetical protein
MSPSRQVQVGPWTHMTPYGGSVVSRELALMFRRLVRLD